MLIFNVLLPGKILSGEEDGLEDEAEKNEVASGSFSSKTYPQYRIFIYIFQKVILVERGTNLNKYLYFPPASGTDGSSSSQVDIITEQPRSSQHTLQPGDSVDLSASSEQGGSGGTCASQSPESPNENEEEMLSRSSSGGANITPETADYTTPENATPEGPLVDGGTILGTNDHSLPPSDSSQTTTEGPDSAVTPSDVAELVSLTVETCHNAVWLFNLH